MRFHALTDQPRTAVAPGVNGTSDDDAKTGKEKAALNLLEHIPGDASGLYLFALSVVTNATHNQLWLFFGLAFIVMIVLRWLANATLAIHITSAIAFVLWMFVIDGGVFKVVFPNFLAGGSALVVAVFYHIIVTSLASAGKIK